MSSGGGVLGLLFGLTLGASVILMALGRYQSLAAGLNAMRTPLVLRQQARLALLELGRDLRMHAQAGCSFLTLASPAQGGEARIAYMQMDWSIARMALDAEKRHLQALWLYPPEAWMPLAGEMVVSSCNHAELLAAGSGFVLEQQDLLLHLTMATPLLLGGESGHHLPSLTLGPLLVRHYRQGKDARGKGILLRRQNGGREQLLLTDVHAFSVRELSPDLIQVELLFGSEVFPWKMQVARRQRGMTQLVVMALMLAGMLLLATTQRLLLDERRLQQQHVQWWQTLQIAENALRNAELAVAILPGKKPLPHHFVETCLQSRPLVALRKTGRCRVPAVGENVQPARLRDIRLQPCSNAWCLPLPLYPSLTWPGLSPPARTPHAQRRPAKGGGKFKSLAAPNHCPLDPLAGPFNPRPCHIVELLDAQYRGGALYRITVRAWGWSTRTRVTLQSYYAVGDKGQRLSWQELP
jgi:type IV pilus assembly protein PilX